MNSLLAPVIIERKKINLSSSLPGLGTGNSIIMGVQLTVFRSLADAIYGSLDVVQYKY